MNFGEAKANDIIWIEGKKFVFKKMSTEPFWCLQEDFPKEVARLYGQTAKKLKEGQILRVEMTSIEGRDVAILEDAS